MTPLEKTNQSYPMNEIAIGLKAPIDAFAFLWNRKSLFCAAIFGHVIILVLYFWSFRHWGIPRAEMLFSEYFPFLASPSTYALLLANVLLASVYVFAALVYALVGVPVANLLLSPLFDLIASSAYESVSGNILPKVNLSVMAKSLLVELVKVGFIVAIVVGALISTFLLFLSPFFVLFGIWFYGWQEVDRTLGLCNLNWKQRIGFGLKHWLACTCFGIWYYVPLVGTIFAFVMCAGGAIVAARLIDSDILGNAANKKLMGKSTTAFFDERR